MRRRGSQRGRREEVSYVVRARERRVGARRGKVVRRSEWCGDEVERWREREVRFGVRRERRRVEE